MIVFVDDYTFSLETSTDDLGEEYVYEITSLQPQPYPCLRITVYNNTGNIETLNYYANCAIGEKMLERAHGTILMLKFALHYVHSQHPDVEEFYIQDETYANIPEKPLITARRLLEGKLGWYEEHFQAVPEGSTKMLLTFLRDPIRRPYIEQAFGCDKPKSWWTPSNIMKICEEIRCPVAPIGTNWKIRRETIKDYNIKYTVSDQMIGGDTRKKINRLWKKSKPYPYDVILNAKYRNI